MYGTEAVLPSEFTFGSLSHEPIPESEQDNMRADDINFIEELWCRATLRAAQYQ